MRTIPNVKRPSRRRGRTSAVTLGLAAVTTVVVLAGCGGDPAAGGDDQFEFQGATPAGEVIPVGSRTRAPEFSGELLDGTSFDSAELAGDVAVINFWGSWCAPCRLETPDLQAVHLQTAAQGVQFLGVDVKDQRQLAVAFLADAGADYPSLFDPRGEVALAFRGFPANVVPSTIVLDQDGDVAAVYTGAVDQPGLTAALTTLIDEDGGQ